MSVKLFEMWSVKPKRSDDGKWVGIGLHNIVGILVGIFLPLFAAALYRTYSINISPNWLDLTRQIGLPFAVVEIGLIMWARCQGFDPVKLVADLSFPAREALWFFLSTFWIGSLLTSKNWSFSTVLTMISVVHLLLLGAIYHLSCGQKHFDVVRFGGWISAGLALLSGWTAFHFLFPPADLVVDQGITGWGAAIPGFISHRLFGAWAGAVSVLLLGLLWQAPAQAPYRLWLYAAFVLATGVGIWTGTRAAVLGFLIGALAAMLMAGRPATRDFYWKTPTALLLAMSIGMALVPYNDPAFMFYRPGTYGTANEISSGRTVYWLNALHAVAEHPWLGSGAGSSWWLVSDGAGFKHVQPHNALIQFLLSWGIIPTLPFIGLFGYATWHVHHIVRRVREIIPLVMTIDALLAMSMFDGILYFANFLMLIAILFGVCFSKYKLSSGNNTHQLAL